MRLSNVLPCIGHKEIPSFFRFVWDPPLCGHSNTPPRFAPFASYFPGKRLVIGSSLRGRHTPLTVRGSAQRASLEWRRTLPRNLFNYAHCRSPHFKTIQLLLGCDVKITTRESRYKYLIESKAPTEKSGSPHNERQKTACLAIRT